MLLAVSSVSIRPSTGSPNPLIGIASHTPSSGGSLVAYSARMRRAQSSHTQLPGTFPPLHRNQCEASFEQSTVVHFILHPAFQTDLRTPTASRRESHSRKPIDRLLV